MIAVGLGARHEEGGTLRVALALVIPLAAALLQTTVVPFISVGGARPNLPFLVAGAWAIAAGAGEGVWGGFIREAAGELPPAAAPAAGARGLVPALCAVPAACATVPP